MCGIFAVLRDKTDRQPPTLGSVESQVIKATDAIAASDVVAGFSEAADALAALNNDLLGAAGIRSMLDPKVRELLTDKVNVIESRIVAIESDLDNGALPESVSLEALNKSLVKLKDATWSVSRDRLRTANAVLALGSEGLENDGVEIYTSIQLALSAIDRLEVRGRDSAGIAVLVEAASADLDKLQDRINNRIDPLFRSRAVQRSENTVVFVYKAAAEIGALGDNVKAIREAVSSDALLREVAAIPGAQGTIVSHTRWASVGTISEPNASPIDSHELSDGELPYVIAALNGDVDNYVQLKTREQLHVPEEITTDVKVIPTLTAKRLVAGESIDDAFRNTVAEFDGSVAIAAAIARDPSQILLATKGSGQGCYIGLAEGAFLVASEPYGVVEECTQYVRLDGESASAKSGKAGQVVVLSREGAGTLAGIRRLSYGGEEIPVTEDDLTSVEVTTRDIDRGEAPHFLLKEIMEAPQSIRRTLRGKITEERGRLHVALAEDAFPESIKSCLKEGVFKQVIAIGQGTAFIASRSLIAMLDHIAPGAIATSARPATEISGFALRDDMSDTLIVAVSQSGTTTDTNRTVDMIRARGGKVIAIVNRRQSDLTEKADGVLYTSDGRDVEMSVASTKAFYAQVSACTLLAIAISDCLAATNKQESQAILTALRKLPESMVDVLAKRPEISAAASTYGPPRKSWAVVGNGPNHIAAQELRIKLSELCYKSIAVDITEDKKHIDLSAEPMILVCAAGLTGSNAVDVAKEVAIYKAHKALAIVIASEGTSFDQAAQVITVPKLHPAIDFILSTMVGHLFGYEAALAIDAQGRLMRSARGILDDVISHNDDEERLLAELNATIVPPAQAIFDALKSGALNGHLEPSTAVQVASLLRYAMGVLPLDVLEAEQGHPTSPSKMAEELMAALSKAVDELTRPIDAVKHQAKTVTVGLSRTEDAVADNRLVREAITSGADNNALSYRTMRTLVALDAAVQSVVGYTRYSVSGSVEDGTATLSVLDKGGIAEGIASRAETDPRLTGTKHRAAYEQLVTVGRGQRDGRSVIIVPEVKDRKVTAITLLHVAFDEKLDAERAKAVLTGYRQRYSAIVDAVTETEPDFNDKVLEQVPFIELLTEPVYVLADHWRR
jgi:glucosamine--fructose-6-phosphate aminotransferase (isomerizing)